MTMVKRVFFAVIILTLASEIAMRQQTAVGAGQTYPIKENIMKPIPDKLRSVALQNLNANDKAWWVRDVTHSYGKLDLERLYWIIDSEDKSITVVQGRNEEFFSLNGPEGLALSSKLLAKAYGKEPWIAMGVEKLGKTIMSWYRDPRAYILTEVFFGKQQPVIKSWLTGREKDPASLKAVCREPVFTLSDGNWSLDLNAINRYGGVERWIIQGQTVNFMIKDIFITKVKDEGTFNFPDEL